MLAQKHFFPSTSFEQVTEQSAKHPEKEKTKHFILRLLTKKADHIKA